LSTEGRLETYWMIPAFPSLKKWKR